MKRKLDMTALEAAVSRIVALTNPKAVVLFGSHARGDAHDHSDVDLLVIAENPPSWREATAMANEIAADLSLQLVFLSPTEWEETRDVVGGIAYPAHREGRVLYAA